MFVSDSFDLDIMFLCKMSVSNDHKVCLKVVFESSLSAGLKMVLSCGTCVISFALFTSIIYVCSLSNVDPFFHSYRSFHISLY